MRVSVDGAVFEGAEAIDIVRQMRATASPWQMDSTLARYMDRVADRFQLFGKRVYARGTTDEERAASLLEGLIECGFAKPVD
jgi:hypothetical protein